LGLTLPLFNSRSDLVELIELVSGLRLIGPTLSKMLWIGLTMVDVVYRR